MIETISGSEVPDHTTFDSKLDVFHTALPRGQFMMEDILVASYQKLKKSELMQVNARKETSMLKNLLIERTIVQLIQVAERLSVGELAEQRRREEEIQKKKSKTISKFSKRLFSAWTRFLTRKCTVNLNRSITYGRK